MNGGVDGWSISTGEGVSLDAEELVNLLSVHHRRLIDTWQGFTPGQWEHPSRNADWTVHDTVRHVADAMERVTAVVKGEPGLGKVDFDPRSTPVTWLASSEGELPGATIDRFAAASSALRTGIAERFAAGDNAHDPTVYGVAHWTVNVAHVLWDSWIHERDVLLPLGLPAPSSEEEERLVGMYGLLMALVPSMMFEQSASATVELRGIGIHIVEVSCGAGSARSAEVSGGVVSGGVASTSGVMSIAVDALAGRGSSVADALPGAPDELGMLAAFFHS